MHRSLKRNLVLGLAALALAAFAGGAYAATQNVGPSSRQAFLNDVAKRLHVTPQQLDAALSGAAIDQLQAAVKAGRLTQAQANALEQRLKTGVPAPGFPGPIGPLGGFGFARPGGPRSFAVPGTPMPYAVPVPVPGFAPGFKAGFGALPAAASYLGMAIPQLVQQLSAGKSLAQIATSKGKSVGGLEQAMTAAERRRLDRLVTNKVITKAMENQILSKWSVNLSTRVNGKGLSGGGPLGLFRGGPSKPYGPAFRLPAPGKPPAPGSAGSPPTLPAPGKLPAPQNLPVPGAATPAVPAPAAPTA